MLFEVTHVPLTSIWTLDATLRCVLATPVSSIYRCCLLLATGRRGTKNPLAPSNARTDHRFTYLSGFDKSGTIDQADRLPPSDSQNSNFTLTTESTNLTEGAGNEKETAVQRGVYIRALEKLFQPSSTEWPLLRELDVIQELDALIDN
ncbi:hypothetical protein OC842_008013, partial [Tilletia horrida]